MRRLNMLDASWLLVESPETAMQVAGLQIFRVPKDAPPDFMQRFVAYLRSFPVSTPPRWGCCAASASPICTTPSMSNGARARS